MIEDNFVSELFYAEIMGLPTEGLSRRWPKSHITAFEAEEFCRKRSEQEGIPWRLPTSEEWDADFTVAPFIHSVYGWTSTMSGSLRVLRGGCFYYDAAFVRAGLRNYVEPGYRYYYLGFRCARDGD